MIVTDWSAVQSAFIAWIEDTTGRNCTWRDDRQPVGDPNPYFRLHIQSLRERGIMGVTYVYDADQDEMVPAQTRLVDIILEVSCIANAYVEGSLALQEISKLRARTWIPQYLEGLEAVGVSLQTSSNLVSVPFTHQGREMSQATAEFQFQIHDVYQDPSLTASYINNVNNSGNIPDVDNDP